LFVVCCFAYQKQCSNTPCLPAITPTISTDGQQPTVKGFNMYANTAAHKTLPFGTRLRVCYSGCVDVRINDRGPFIGARELDLSYGAASALVFWDQV
jgi:hypothetical protein